MAVQYQGSAKSTPFQPVKALDQTGQMREQLNQQVQWMREDQQDVIQNRRDIANSMAERARQDQFYAEKDVERLASMSKTITDSLLQGRQRKREADWQEGFNQAFMEGVPPAEQQAYEKNKEQLAAVSAATTDVALKLDKEGVPAPAIRRLTELTGDRRVGYLTGLAQQLGMNYGNALQQRMNTDSTTQIDIGNGQTITPKDGLEGGAKLAAVQAWFRNQYVKENGLVGANVAMLNDKFIPLVKEQEGQIAARINRRALISQGEVDSSEIISLGLNRMKAGDVPVDAFNEMVRRLSTTINPETGELYRRGQAIDAAIKAVSEASEEPGQSGITTQTLDAIEAGPDLDGSNTWGNRFKNKFLGIRRRIAASEQADAELARREQREAADSFVEESLRLAEQNGGLTDAEVDFIATEARRLGGVNYSIPEALSSYLTKNKIADQVAEQILKGKLADGIPITERDLAGMSADIRLKYRDQIRNFNNDIAKNPETQAHFKDFDAKLRENALDTELRNRPGYQPDGYNYAKQLARQIYIEQYNNLVRAGRPPAEARATANEFVRKRIEEGVKYGTEGKGIGDFALDRNRLGRGFFNIWGRSRLGNADQARQRVQWIESQINGNRDALTRVKLISDQDVAVIQEIAKNPSIPPPESVRYITRKLNEKGKAVDEYEVMDAQLRLFGVPGLTIKRPPGAEILNTIDPRFKQLLTRQQSMRRTMRGMASVPGWNKAKVPNAQWGEFVEQAAAQNGLDPAVLAGLIMQESSWRPGAVNADAVGLGQIRPGTARELGVTNRNDPKQSIFGAAKYLKKMLDKFNGDLPTALMAYNAGDNAIMRNPRGVSDDNRKYPRLVMQYAAQYGYGNRGLASPELLHPRLAYRIASLGYGSTGPHLDVKPVRKGTMQSDSTLPSYRKGDLDNFVSVKVKGKLVPLSKGTETTDDDRAHRSRKKPSFGHDYAAPTGTQVFLKNGAKVVGSFKGDQGTDHLIIELPDGRRYQFLHGTKA